MKRVRMWIPLVVIAASACAHLRAPPTEETPPAEQPPPAYAAPPPENEPNVPQTGNEGSQPDSANTAVPLCVPPETKSKPKPKPKPKPARKEAPPQLPTAPVVAETPPGGVVDAQVKPMPVSVMSILGKRVQGPKGEDLGRVVDVLADATGRVRIAIIDFGGFLGVGDRRIAVDWPLLRFAPDGRDPSLLLSVGRDKLKSAPEYKDNPRPQTLMERPASVPPASAPAAGASTPAENKK